MDGDWLQHRHYELYHWCIEHIIQDINELCSRDIYIHFADDEVWCSRAFYQLPVMDDAKMASALLCDVTVDQCPVCTCPLSWIEVTSLTSITTHNFWKMLQVVAGRSDSSSQHLDDSGLPNIIPNIDNGPLHPDISIPNIEPNIKPNIRIRYILISGYPMLNPILEVGISQYQDHIWYWIW